MSLTPDAITISADKNKLNATFIHHFLTTAYWSKGRTLEQVKRTIDNSSYCFGVYLNDLQIGFARVVADGVVFAYLMDVFIDPEHRGRGYSKMLMQAILEHEDLRSIGTFYLKTNDAHGLYEQFDFKRIRDPELFMERKNKGKPK